MNINETMRFAGPSGVDHHRVPILPGKTPAWRTFIEELNGPRRREFADSRKKATVHERTFLQQSPMGDFVIVTLEGDDPARSIGQLMSGTGDFSTWFTQNAMAAHGDLTPDSLHPADTRRGLGLNLTFGAGRAFAAGA